MNKADKTLFELEKEFWEQKIIVFLSMRPDGILVEGEIYADRLLALHDLRLKGIKITKTVEGGHQYRKLETVDFSVV